MPLIMVKNIIYVTSLINKQIKKNKNTIAPKLIIHHNKQLLFN